MAVYHRSVRTRYVLAVLVLAALTLITIDARSNGTGFTGDVRAKAHDVFSPLQRATHAALGPVGNFLTGAADYGSLRHENEILRDQVASLQKRSIQAGAEQAAAEQVLAEQHLPFVGQIPTVSAEVIDNGASNFENVVTVDKGTSSGIAAGEPVVAAGGLVGSVQAASAHTATVVLLTDPSFAVGVRLDANNVGTARGTGRTNPIRVTVDTPQAAPPKLAKGQPLVTSGLDLEKFPPNIPVGRVLNATIPPGAAEPDVTLAPLVNLGQLAYLQVLLWSPQ
ncbi:MAG: rod shape-determining protein MreC [Acidimicrobiales bacterium]